RVRDHPHLLRRQLPGDGDLTCGGVVDVLNDPGVVVLLLRMLLKQSHCWFSSLMAFPDMSGSCSPSGGTALSPGCGCCVRPIPFRAGRTFAAFPSTCAAVTRRTRSPWAP